MSFMCAALLFRAVEQDRPRTCAIPVDRRPKCRSRSYATSQNGRGTDDLTTERPFRNVNILLSTRLRKESTAALRDDVFVFSELEPVTLLSTSNSSRNASDGWQARALMLLVSQGCQRTIYPLPDHAPPMRPESLSATTPVARVDEMPRWNGDQRIIVFFVSPIVRVSCVLCART